VGRIAQVGAATHYYLSDGLGSTMALTDEAGSVVNDYDYDVFGALRDSSGSQPNDFTFAGEQVDGSTGLQYLRARYYDVAAGRFAGKDPFFAASSSSQYQNRYSYVTNNPLVLLDPMGLCGLSLKKDNLNDCKKKATKAVSDAGNTALHVAGAVATNCTTPGSVCVTGVGLSVMAVGFATADPALVMAGSGLLTISDSAQCYQGVSSGKADPLVCGNAALGWAGLGVMQLETAGYRAISTADPIAAGLQAISITCVKYCPRGIDFYTFISGLRDLTSDIAYAEGVGKE
jgi:RHS repeat-associated protein